jgi:hypothetical protein
LSAQIGPVWATSPGLATKFVRAIKAGFRAPRVEALLDCPLWILHAPSTPPSQLLNLALGTGLPLGGRIVAALDDHAGSESLHLLQEMGASVATFWPPADSSMPFFVEGQPEATYRVVQLLRGAGLAAQRLREGAKRRFVTARGLSRTVPAPLLEAVARCLEQAGVSRPVAQRLALHWISIQMRSYAASGRKAWIDPGRGSRQGQLELGLDHLRQDDAALAEGLEQILELCQRLMKPGASSLKAVASKG